MRNLLPKSARFAMIDLEGGAAKDFAQRMFTRDFRRLGVGEGRLSLFLSSDGKVQYLFWAFVEDFGLRLFVNHKDQKGLFDLIEHYHFADAFTTQIKAEIPTYWEASESTLVGVGKFDGSRYSGEWRNTKFIFENLQTSQSASDSQLEKEWNLHCEKNKISTDYYQQLVFKTGLEELCDPGKGCYIGQEIVERVRTRDLRESTKA